MSKLEELLVDLRPLLSLAEKARVSLGCWIFVEEHPSPCIQGHRVFADVSRPAGKGLSIAVVDQFDGRCPIEVTGALPSPLIPTILLDSNVVSALSRYLDSESQLRAGERNAIREFVSFLVQGGFDYNPLFYILESIGEAPDTETAEAAWRASQTMLHFHTMDEPHFLATGEVRVDPKRLVLYQEQYSAETIPEIAARQMGKTLCQEPAAYFRDMMNASRAMLLKMALIHRTTRASLRDKYALLREFSTNVMKMNIGRESVLAIYYFSGQMDRFIPLQRTSSFRKFQRSIRSAVWDILLLRMPEYLLGLGKPSGTMVAYVCTGDRALQKVAQCYKIRAVGTMKPTFPAFPLMEVDLTDLDPITDGAVLDEIVESEREWEDERLLHLQNPGNYLRYLRDLPSGDDLKRLVQELEAEVERFCEP